MTVLLTRCDTQKGGVGRGRSPLSLRLWTARVIFVFAALCSLPNPGLSLALPALCERAAEWAAKQTDVPVSVMKAITLGESGRGYEGVTRPWPWTVNMEGAGHWFDTEAEARHFVGQHFDRGARSFDVGCFQINYKWHHGAFQSVDQMFDPLANALYAGEFLQSLFQEFGTWEAAAGAYHSRRNARAVAYGARFSKLRARFRAEDGRALPKAPDVVLARATAGVDQGVRKRVIRENTFPLFLPGDGQAVGSLVPLNRTAGQALFSDQGQPAAALFPTEIGAAVRPVLGAIN